MDSPFPFSIDLATIREEAGLTQVQLARILGVDQGTISRAEKAPDKQQMKFLRDFQIACGYINVDPTGIDVGDPYWSLRATQSDIIKYLGGLEFVDKVTEKVIEPTHLARLGKNVSSMFKKPRIAVAGGRDAGKSLILNTLLGARLLPSRPQATTAAPVLIRHLRERPVGLTNTCYVMPGDFDFDDATDSEKILNLAIAKGDRSLLFSEGTHAKGSRQAANGVGAEDLRAGLGQITDKLLGSKARKAKRSETTADSQRKIILFAESQILLGCDLIDTPGYLESQSDTLAANAALEIADFLILCSKANTFLIEAERQALERFVDRRYPKGSGPAYLILSTRAAPPLEMLEIRGIWEAAFSEYAERVYERRNGPEAFAAEADDVLAIVDELMGQSLCTYIPTGFEGADVEDRLTPFRARVRELLATDFPAALKQHFAEDCANSLAYVAGRLDTSRDTLLTLMQNKEKARDVLAELRAREASAKSSLKEGSVLLKRKIENSRRSSEEALSLQFAVYTKASYVENYIKSRYREDEKKRAKSEVVSRLTEALASEIKGVCEDHARQINETMIALLDDITPISDALEAAHVDKEVAFVGSIASATRVGIAGAVAVSLAAAAGSTTAAGLGFASYAAATALIPGLGTMVAIAGGLGLLALAAYEWFGDWRPRLAEKVANLIKESDLQANLSRGLTEHWSRMGNFWSEQIEQKRRDIDTAISMLEYTVDGESGVRLDQMGELLDEAERLTSFFFAAPWPRDSLRIVQEARGNRTTSRDY